MPRIKQKLAFLVSVGSLAAACGPSRPGTAPTPSHSAAHPNGLTLPIDDPAIAEKLRDPAALGHVRGFAVDESCFDIKQIPEEISKKEPLHLTTTNIGGVNVATIDETTADAFSKLHAWIELFPKSPTRRFVYSRSFEKGAQKGWMATCLVARQLIDDGDFGRVVHKDPALNEKSLDIAFSDPALLRMKTLPPNVQRVVFLYDDTDVLAMIFLDDLRKLDKPVVTLAKF